MSLKNISVSVYVFFFGLLIFSLASIAFFKQDKSKTKGVGTNIPNVTIEGFDFYLLDLENLALIANGKTLLRYSGYDEAYELFAYQMDSMQRRGEMYAPFAKAQKDIYFFPQNVRYVREDGLSLWSEKGVYDYHKRIFQGEGKFFFDEDGTDLHGLNVLYNQNTDFISGIELGGFIELGDS